MSKIGILGGTFDPIHNGHIELATKAYNEFKLDKVLVMPSKKPPHKITLTSDIHRSNMVKLAISDYDYMEFSDVELTREGYIYTADTLTELKKHNNLDEFYFIMGGDSLDNFLKWYHPEIILQKAIILAAFRDDMDINQFNLNVTNIKNAYPDVQVDIRYLITDRIDVSSTIIRNSFANKKLNICNESKKESIDIKKYINSKVYDYILSNKLYQE